MKSYKYIVIVLFCLLLTLLRAQTGIMDSKGNFCFLNNEKLQISVLPSVKLKEPVFADFNGDGLTDIAYVANNDNRLLIHLNAGTNSVTVFNNTVVTVHHNLFYNSGNAVAVDFNNDGKPDLATINNFGNVYTFRNNGGANFSTDSIMPAISGSGYFGKLYPMHVDNDNRMDLLSVSITSSPVPGFHFAYLKNVSSPGGPLAFTTPTAGILKTILNFGDINFDGQAADFNNDGLDEFMFVSDLTGDSITMLYSIIMPLNIKTTFGAGNAGVTNKKIMLTDVNSDGGRDIAVMGGFSANLNYVYVYAPVITGTIITGLNTQTIVPLFYKSRDFTFSDLNNDGLKELVVINGNTNAIQIYPQKQALSFGSPPVTFSVNNHTPLGIKSVDIDNNLRRDLISFADTVTSTLALIRNFTYRDSLYAIPNQSVLCNGESILLKHQLLGYSSPFSSTYSNFQPSQTHTLSISASGVYTSNSTYTVINSGLTCSVTTNSLTIGIGITPTIVLSGPLKVCEADSALITASGAMSYTWSNATQGSSNIIIPMATSYYSVTGMSADGCKSSQSATLDVYTNPTVSISYNKNNLCKNETAVITASGALNYFWSNGVVAPSIVVTQTGTASQSYTVIGIDANGCKARSNFETIVNTNCPEEIKITNGLTPNNDGNNDFLYIENIEKYPNNKVSVFNRWGGLIFSEKGYDNREKIWPKANANILTGTYYYIVEPGNGEPIIKGWLEIIGN